MNKTRLVAAAVAFALLAFQVAPASLATAAQETYHIFNASQLHELSRLCSFDKWSKDRIVILENDIDLGDGEFTPIPIFGGVFLGQGYKIRALAVKVDGSNQGFIRYLQEGAAVKDLTVEGTVTPGGSKSNVGGIVGNNSGTIANCTFSGQVKGNERVGGIAGRNSDLGTITDCTSQGIVYGKSVAGGIAGYNAGAIVGCRNEASVNTTVEETTIGLQDLTLDDIGPFDRSFLDAIDIGGIAGINVGKVAKSENHGSIGYPHVGYNVGGIAGRQSGHIDECFNHGTVLGRKDVAGIVGQMEPYISTLSGPLRFRALQAELNTLQSLITKLLRDVDTSSGAMHKDLSSVEKNLDETKKHAESLIDQTESLLNKDIEEINRLAAIMTEMADRLGPVMDDLADVVEKINKSLPFVRHSMNYLAIAMGKMPDMASSFSDMSSVMEQAMDSLEEAGDHISLGLSDLIEALELAINGDMAGAQALLDSARDHLNDGWTTMRDTMDFMRLVLNHMTDIIQVMADAAYDMSLAITYLSDAIAILETAMPQVAWILKDMGDLMKYLAEQPPLEFETTDEEFDETKDSLSKSMDGLVDSVFRLMDTLKDEEDVLLPDIQEVSDQLFLVMDMVLEIAAEVEGGEYDPSDMVQDVSRDDTDGQIDGKVKDSKNLGCVEGDINVGGIVGAMAIEYLPDAEEEISLESTPGLRTVYRTRAVVSHCENRGVIIAKKNCAGGIAGNMDLGYINNCVSAGPVESTDGHYVGGIAGKAYGPIDSCYAKTSLGGGDYVGGITGLGQEILDCYSMVTVERGKSCVGAIAGYAEQDSVIKNNYFVSDSLAGIDGISYMGRAEPLSYEELVARDGVPPIFREFRLSFWADDKLVGTIDFEYGASVDERDMPDIPPKPGQYHRWEETPTENLVSSLDIHAVYSPYIKTLESSERREGPLPLVVVEGEFTHLDRVSAAGVPGAEGPDLERGKLLEMWEIEIPGDGVQAHSVRFAPPQEKGVFALYLLHDGDWAKIKTRSEGKYLVFSAASNRLTLALVQEPFHYTPYWVALGAAVLVSAAFYLSRRRRRRKPAVLTGQLE